MLLIEMKEETRKWLQQARRDLTTAKNSLKSKDYYAVAFWCQQSAEKAFKALLIEKTEKFPKIHDLSQLARLNATPNEILDLCAKLNPAYIVARYPDSPKKYTKQECEEVVNAANKVLLWIKKNIN